MAKIPPFYQTPLPRYDERRYVALLKYCEQGNYKKPFSRRALLCLRLISLFSNYPHLSHKEVVFDPNTDEVTFGRPYLPNNPVYSLPKDSEWDEIGYALAVNLSAILIGSHPYKGKVWFETPLLTPKIEHQIFTTEEFILATNSKAQNAPQPGAQDQVIALYNSLPPKLRPEFKPAFVRGDNSRPWFPKNERLENSSENLREILWGIVSTYVPQRVATIKVNIDGYEYLLAPGKSLISPLDFQSIGYCEEKMDKRGKQLVFHFDASQEWKIVTKPYLSVRYSPLPPGKPLIISENMNFDTYKYTISSKLM